MRKKGVLLGGIALAQKCSLASLIGGEGALLFNFSFCAHCKWQKKKALLLTLAVGLRIFASANLCKFLSSPLIWSLNTFLYFERLLI